MHAQLQFQITRAKALGKGKWPYRPGNSTFSLPIEGIVGVNLRGFGGGVSQQLLNRSQIRPILSQMGSKRMSQRVHCCKRIDSGFCDPLS